MTPTEAHNNLRNAVAELIVKMNAQANADKINAMVEKYITACGENSHYDQVANANEMVAMYQRCDIKGFLSSLQHMDTLNHINSDKDMFHSLGKK